MGNLTYFEHQQKEQMLLPTGARNTLRTAMLRERERLGSHHVANDAFNFLEVSENDMQQEQYEKNDFFLGMCII